MQGIILNILQHMKSASHSTISALMFQGDGALVISARVFYGSEKFVISSRVYQTRDASHLGTGISMGKVARRNCQMPTIPHFLFSITDILRRI